MRNLILTLSILLFSMNMFAQVEGNAIIGKWQTENSESLIEFYLKGDTYFGKVAWLKDPNQPNGRPKVDKNNPDENLRNKPILGMDIITGLEYKMGKWVNGEIYGPEKGKSAQCEIAVINNEMTLSISKFFYSVTKVWKKI